MFFDVVIPLGPHDVHKIHRQLEATKKNVIGLRNIYIITSASFDIAVEGVIIIHENEFPFQMSDVARILSPTKRNGWYFQQLLKMYAGLVIPGVTGGEPMDRYLIIDADTVFLRPVSFVDAEDRCLYNWSGENEDSYYEHMKRLHPSFIKTFPDKSGICHHMMIETKIMQELMGKVEEYHEGKKPFWQIFLEKVEPRHYEASGGSEYEIYFHYIFREHPDSVVLRPLRWANKHGNFKIENADKSLDYVSTHWWVRPSFSERPFLLTSRMTRRLRMVS